MLGNEFVTGLVAIFLGYMFGSLPSAYLITKIVTGRDIRRLGGGNVGGLNTFKEVGIFPAVVVVLLDIGKGVAVILLTHFALGLEQLYVLMAAGGAVAGHNWMPWLKFTGGKGMAAAVGTISAIFIIYQHPQVLLYFFGVLLLILLLTRNVVLANGVSLVALPVICWLALNSGVFVIWSVVMGLIIAIKFLPASIRTLNSGRGRNNYSRGR